MHAKSFCPASRVHGDAADDLLKDDLPIGSIVYHWASVLLAFVAGALLTAFLLFVAAPLLAAAGAAPLAAAPLLPAADGAAPPLAAAPAPPAAAGAILKGTDAHLAQVLRIVPVMGDDVTLEALQAAPWWGDWAAARRAAAAAAAAGAAVAGAACRAAEPGACGGLFFAVQSAGEAARGGVLGVCLEACARAGTDRRVALPGSEGAAAGQAASFASARMAAVHSECGWTGQCACACVIRVYRLSRGAEPASPCPAGTHAPALLTLPSLPLARPPLLFRREGRRRLGGCIVGCHESQARDQ